MGLRQEIHKAVVYKDFWARYYPEAQQKDSDEVQVLCPFHDDKEHKSLSMSMVNGMFKCFTPTCGVQGDIVDFYAKMERVDVRTAIKKIASELNLLGEDKPQGLPPIDELEVQSAHKRLMEDPEQLSFLIDKRGFSKKIITERRIGYSSKEGRIWFPIRDNTGACVNIKKHKFGATKTEIKSLSWKKGYGKARLYPSDQLKHNSVIICAGEPDAMALISMGLPAVTNTAGEGTFKKAWKEEFVKKHVAVMYDIDDAGRVSSARICDLLFNIAASVKNVLIPVPRSDIPKADVTDWIVRYGATKKDILKLIKEAKPYDRKRSKEDQDKTVYEVSLDTASQPEYHRKTIKLRCLVAGKELAPYVVPTKVWIGCNLDFGKQCTTCPVFIKDGTLEAEVNDDTVDLLSSINVPTYVLENHVKNKLGLPIKCNKCKIETTASLNIEEIRIIPEVDFSQDMNQYVNRRAYYISDGKEVIRTNKTYEMDGTTLPDPKTQVVIHVVNKIKATKDNLESFVVTDEISKELSVFHPDKPGSAGVNDKFCDIVSEISKIAGIYQRDDLFIMTDLIFHSALSFYFLGKFVKRGWTQGLVLGDTRCGKTAAMETVIRHYRAGELITGESVSFAGLVGGINNFGKTFSLQWGKIPLADRRLVVIDEISGMSYEQIGEMSSLRSSGIAEITKIHTERTNARTRQIWMSNVRGIGRRLDGYAHGVLAIKELIGKLEDISRFDIALTVATDEVGISSINKRRTTPTNIGYDSNVCNKLVMWAWSRKAGHIKFVENSEDLILKIATKQGKEYSSAIPLVEPAEQREKIARLSIAAAARVHSTDKSGEFIVVKPCHVEFIDHFLDYAYKKGSMGYDEYSASDQAKKKIQDEAAVAKFVNDDIAATLLDTEYYTQTDLLTIYSDWPPATAKQIIAAFMRNKALMRIGRSGGYRKTPAFIKFLKTKKYQKFTQVPPGQEGSI